ncbi:hypothetical protein [Leptospira stimsonii]|uniref:hypothetical protein n=1 Tax=Leptospira stimsonii TaxID=2202203 RepID=UPI0014383E8A|nr:hypothetical protein [Leptospira stimsonii]
MIAILTLIEKSFRAPNWKLPKTMEHSDLIRKNSFLNVRLYWIVFPSMELSFQ